MILLLMGAPGAGKGTQSQSIVDKLNIVQISTGDILRKAVSEETDLGLTAKKYMDSGDLVPDEVVIGIIEQRVQEPDCSKGFILDGFPRTKGQATSLDEMLEKIEKPMDHVVYFDVPEKELMVRLLLRSEKEGRSDDNLETIKNRLQVFKEKTEELINFYQLRGLIRYVDGTGTEGDVRERLFSSIGI